MKLRDYEKPRGPNVINRALIVMDASNFEYVCVFHAYNEWAKNNLTESAIIQRVENTDQNNLPNLLVYDSFRRTLHNTVQSKIHSFMWISKSYHPNELHDVDDVDVIFTLDDKLSNNFRRKLYPEYKAQRKLMPKKFDVQKAKEYIQNVIFKELDIENTMGYRVIGVEGCESDDIIATVMKMYKNYAVRILISSDRDFLQIEGINQYDFFAKQIYRRLTADKATEMSPQEFLLWKIICGDKSDNIPHVFEKFGDKKSYGLMKDKEKLKMMLRENLEAANRFKLNKQLIDFNSIPSDVTERIEKVVREKMESSIKMRNEIEEFSLNSCIEI